MGVPGLEPFVCARSRGSVTEIIQGEDLTRTVDYFYADANGALHSICQRVFNYGEKKSAIDFYEGIKYDDKIKAVFEEFFVSVVSVTKIVKPKVVLYIALDGPAPLAKQNQQRQRRFGRSYASASSSSSSKQVQEFDTNCITPGTQFMHDLTVFMRKAIAYAMTPKVRNRPSSSSSSSSSHASSQTSAKEFEEMKNIQDVRGVWSDIEVIFSPPTVPGEGEHKLMEYTRSLPEEERTTRSHCFFGPDGDLIMLGLTSALDHVFLLRQDQYRSGYYKYIDIGQGFSSTISHLFGRSFHTSIQHTKDDFVIAGLFVGNDFLPRIQMFVTVKDGLDYMITALKGVNRPLTLSEKTSGVSSLDIAGLLAFASRIAMDEKAMLLDQVLTDDKRRLPPEGDVRYLNILVLKHVFVCQTGSSHGKPDLNYEAYRTEYNATHFGSHSGSDGGTNKESLESVCYDYLKTLIWVFEYYRNGIVDWDWAYRHHYPPLMSDFTLFLANYLVRSQSRPPIVQPIQFKIGKPTYPFEQLLGVLPRSSASLLPEPFSTLLEDPSSELNKSGNFPSHITFDYRGKVKEYEGVILLPFSDYLLVRKVYTKAKEGCRKFNRDTINRPVRCQLVDGVVKMRWI